MITASHMEWIRAYIVNWMTWLMIWLMIFDYRFGDAELFIIWIPLALSDTKSLWYQGLIGHWEFRTLIICIDFHLGQLMRAETNMLLCPSCICSMPKTVASYTYPHKYGRGWNGIGASIYYPFLCINIYETTGYWHINL